MTTLATRTDPTPPPATPPGAARRDRLAFAGLLVAIMRSSEIRAMLVQLVENALGAAG